MFAREMSIFHIYFYPCYAFIFVTLLIFQDGNFCQYLIRSSADFDQNSTACQQQAMIRPIDTAYCQPRHRGYCCTVNHSLPCTCSISTRTLMSAKICGGRNFPISPYQSDFDQISSLLADEYKLLL